MRFLEIVQVAFLGLGVTSAISDEQLKKLTTPKTYISNKSPLEICRMSSDDPQKTWIESGAGRFMEAYIRNKGTGENWLQHMEQDTTGPGGIQPTLDCADREAGCHAPDSNQCTSFTPPAFYWIRIAASNLHTAIASMHESVQSLAIAEGLQLGQLIEDFASKTLEVDAKRPDIGLSAILNILGGAFGIAGGLIGIGSGIVSSVRKATVEAKAGTKTGTAGGVTGVGSGSAWIAGTVITSPVAQELAVTISNHLASINLHLENLTSDLGYLVFNNLENRGGRSLNLDMLRRQPYDTNTATLMDQYKTLDIHPITQFFDLGEWLPSSSDPKSQSQKALNQVGKSLQPGLIALIMRELRVYITRDESVEGRTKCYETGSRTMWNTSESLGWCYTLRHVKDEQHSAVKLDPDVIANFHKHGIDLWSVFDNADRCQQTKGGFNDGQSWTDDFNGLTAPVYVSGFAECLWGALPVFSITDSSRAQNSFANQIDGDGPCVSTTAQKDFPEYLGIPSCATNPEPWAYDGGCAGYC